MHAPMYACMDACVRRAPAVCGGDRIRSDQPPLRRRDRRADHCRRLAVALLLLLRGPGAGDPERAQRAEAVEVVGHRQQRPRHLPRRQDLVQPVQRLVPKVLSLQ